MATGVAVVAALIGQKSLAVQATTTLTTATAVPTTPAGDEILTGRGDADGYHLYLASTQSQWAWQSLATLLPGGNGDDAWLGEQCLTGDGAYAIVVVLPRQALNQPDSRLRGAVAYAVDTRSRSVQPLASGVALTYYTPGCGVGDRVVLTRYLGDDGLTTELITVDLATKQVVGDRTLDAQWTAAVPVGNGITAVEGNSVVALGTSAAADHPLATMGGRPYLLRANDAGGVDALITTPSGGATLARIDVTGARTLGSAGDMAAQLFAGRAGANLVVGSLRLDSTGTNLKQVAAPAGVDVAAASLDGAVLLTADRTPPTQEQRAKLAGTQSLPAATALQLAGSGTALGSGKLPIGSGATSTAVPPSTTASPTALPQPGPPPSTSPPNTTTPTCAVPRNDPNVQVPQPDYHQIDWGIQLAVRNLLVGSYARPAGYLNMGQPSYAANSDFPTPALAVPQNITTSPVPPQVMEGVLAQESNWAQASWHASAGTAGNPLIANYYGTDSTFKSIDYNKADCGYGLSQVTDYMTVASNAVSQPVKVRIAVDYTENIAAGITILSSKWNQLQSLGMIMNNGDPWQLENWYMALWAYNSGIHPDDGFGNSGLGWTNNPKNPTYPPNRSEFLYNSYSDASHPGDWPYQERVIGWMDQPLLTPQGVKSYQSATPPGAHLGIPGINTFCDSSDQCDPNDSTGNYCTRPHDYHCWWNKPVTFLTCPTSCHAGFYNVAATATEPTVTDPYPPACTVSSSDIPPGSLIVDEQPTNLNVVGCPNPPSGWTSGGFFSQTPGTDASGATVGDVDWHQLGAGFGGHMFFTHAYPISNTTQSNTGVWSVNGALPSPGTEYTVKVFVPSMGGTDPGATYSISDGNGNTFSASIDQNSYNNQWVTLGTWQLFGSASVTLKSNHQNPNDMNTWDLAYDAMAFVPENLQYFGGAVQAPSTNIYAIFWNPTGSAPESDYNTLLTQYFQDAATIPEFKDVMPQYYETVNGSNIHVALTDYLMGTWTDTRQYPVAVGETCVVANAVDPCGFDHTSCGPGPCLDDQAVADEVQNAINNNSGWSNQPGNVYLVFPGPGEAICGPGGPFGTGSACSNDPTNMECANHWFSTDHGFVYAAVAYPDQTTNSCTLTGGPDSSVADGAINAAAHELAEMITDPKGNGWCGPSGWSSLLNKCTGQTEIGDKCGLIHVPQTTGTHHYYLQELWSNSLGECAT